jgi:hypothetical protein
MGALRTEREVAWSAVMRDLLERPKGTLVDGIPIARLLRLVAREISRCPECDGVPGASELGCPWCALVELFRK